MHFYNKESLKEWIQIIRARHIFKKLKKDKMEILATYSQYAYLQLNISFKIDFHNVYYIQRSNYLT